MILVTTLAQPLLVDNRLGREAHVDDECQSVFAYGSMAISNNLQYAHMHKSHAHTHLEKNIVAKHKTCQRNRRIDRTCELCGTPSTLSSCELAKDTLVFYWKLTT